MCVHEGERIADAGDLLDAYEAESQKVYDYYKELVCADYSGAKQLLADLEKEEKSCSQKLSQSRLNLAALLDLLVHTQLVGADNPKAKTVEDLVAKLPKPQYAIKKTKKVARTDADGKSRGKARMYYEITGIGKHSISASGFAHISTLTNLPLPNFMDEIEAKIDVINTSIMNENALHILCEFRVFLLKEPLESYVIEGITELMLLDPSEETNLGATPWKILRHDKPRFTKRFQDELIATGKKPRTLWEDIQSELGALSMPYSTLKSFQTVANRNDYEIRRHPK